jgi:hypothetical protein
LSAETDGPCALVVRGDGEPPLPRTEEIPVEIAPYLSATEAVSRKGETRGRNRTYRAAFSADQQALEPRFGVPTAEAAATTTTVPPESVREIEL